MASVSVHGSLPWQWLPRYEELLAAGRDARAMVHFLHSLDFLPGGPLATAAVWGMQRFNAEGRATREVLPTVVREVRVVRELDSDGSRYAAIVAPTLLLGGGRSPAYTQTALTLLAETISESRLVLTPELDHNAPDLSAPGAVAELIRA